MPTTGTTTRRVRALTARVRERAAWVRARAATLRREVRMLAAALRDPRTPWYVGAVAGLAVGLAVSPVDPVPDFVPVLGYLDDLVFVPFGVLLARRAIPEEVLAHAREGADGSEDDGSSTAGWLVALLVLAGWALGFSLVLAFVLPRIGWI